MVGTQPTLILHLSSLRYTCRDPASTHHCGLISFCSIVDALCLGKYQSELLFIVYF